MYTMLVSEYFSSSSPSPVTRLSVSTVELTTDELNAMRYACGYVPHKLLTRPEVGLCILSMFSV